MDPGKIKYIKHIIKNTTPKEVKYSIQGEGSSDPRCVVFTPLQDLFRALRYQGNVL